MTIAVDLGRKATKQTKKLIEDVLFIGRSTQILLDNLTHQLNSVGPDQTPHYVVSHLGSH